MKDKKMTKKLYTTVTVSDFNDAAYIKQLIELEIGMELALLTKLSDGSIAEHAEQDVHALKKEMSDFIDCFNTFNISFDTIRIHQPGGYLYNWSSEFGYRVLQDFFAYCCDQGFQGFVIHIPFGNTQSDEQEELEAFRKKLKNLVPQATLEVEEIVASNADLKNSGTLRFYDEQRFEKLMQGQQAHMLLDVYECGSVEQTIKRLSDLKSKGFEIETVHVHKDKHKFLTTEEIQLLSTSFSGTIVNEGFIQDQSSFDEFVRTKSLDCVVSNEQRIEMLKRYKKVMQW